MILHHPLSPDGRECGHHWHADTADGTLCPACGGDRGIEVTNRTALPVSEPVLTKPGDGHPDIRQEEGR